MSDLTVAQRTTLREMASYDYYTFRQATARSLVALGLAEVVQEKGRVKVRPGHRITAAGHAILKALEKDSAT